MDTEEKPDLSNTNVRNAYNMDDVMFEKHMNHRHRESLGGLDALDLEHCSNYVISCWRKFHNTLHRIYVLQMEHEHSPYRPPEE